MARRISLFLLPALFLACELPVPRELTGERVRAETVFLYYALPDEALEAHLTDTIDALLTYGALPPGLELLVLHDTEGAITVSRRNSSGSTHSSAVEAGLPDLPLHNPQLLSDALDLAAEGLEAGALHLMLPGRSSYADSLTLASSPEGELDIGEIASAIGEARPESLGSLTLASSYGATMGVLYELRDLPADLLAAPDRLALAGSDPHRLIDALAAGSSVVAAVLDATEASHVGIPGSGMGRYDLSQVSQLAEELEALLVRLEGELEDAGERLELREALLDLASDPGSEGPSFLLLGDLARSLSARYPELSDVAGELTDSLSRVSIGGWSETDATPEVALYYVSIGSQGEPDHHAISYLPEAFGPPKCDFVLSSSWPARLESRRGILHSLWYDLLDEEALP